MLRYLCPAILAAFLLYAIVYAINPAATAIMFQGAAIGQAFAYGPSVVRDPKTREQGLVVDQTENKALFASILDCARTRSPAGKAPAVDIQYRFLFVLKDDPRFKALPMGEWVATLVEKSKAG